MTDKKTPSTEMQQVITTANEILEKMSALKRELLKCRNYLRISAEAGIGSQEQIDWIDTYLPKRTKKAKQK